MVKQFWPIDVTLTGATTPVQSRPGGNSNEGVFSKALGLEPHHHIV